jgi:hypothetical protein
VRRDNLPEYRARQLEFAAHVRHPEHNAAPADVEPRRMRIYVDLVYNNVERFLASTFPIVRRRLGDAGWHERVRDFLHRHHATSPFFQEIPQEFLEFIGDEGARPEDPPYLLELAHYEWVEMALDLETTAFPEDVNPLGDLMTEHPVISPLAWRLMYRFPVHRIAADSVVERPEDPTFLVVYRDRADRVRFLEANALTNRLLDGIAADDAVTGAEALDRLATELEIEDVASLRDHGRETLERLRECDIIAGTRER